QFALRSSTTARVPRVSLQRSSLFSAAALPAAGASATATAAAAKCLFIVVFSLGRDYSAPASRGCRKCHKTGARKEKGPVLSSRPGLPPTGILVERALERERPLHAAVGFLRVVVLRGVVARRKRAEAAVDAFALHGKGARGEEDCQGRDDQ